MTFQKHYSDYTTATSAFGLSPFTEAREVWLDFFPPGLALFVLRFQSSTTYTQHSSLEALCGSEVPSCQCFWFSSANGANTHTGSHFQSICPTQTSLCSTCYCCLCFLAPFSSNLIFHPQLSSGFPPFLSLSTFVQSRNEFTMRRSKYRYFDWFNVASITLWLKVNALKDPSKVLKSAWGVNHFKELLFT